MKSAQDFLSESASGHTRGGFNRRMHGDSLGKATYGDRGAIYGDVFKGWSVADEIIKDGKIYSLFPNTKIWFKCERDGKSYCCVGEGFINLMESGNYAFGDSFDEAVSKFLELMNHK